MEFDTPVISDEARWKALQAKRMESLTATCFAYFQSYGFDPLVIKGWATARNYPEKDPRVYRDVDLAFSPLDFRRALELKATDEGSRLAVDVHNGFRHLDTRPWKEVFDDSELVQVNGAQIRVPCAEDHLRMIAAHWLNDGCESKERLWDIYYAVKHRPKDFNWEKCLDSVGSNRQTWVTSAILLAERYLDLDIDDLPLRITRSSLPDWIIRTVEKEWRGGIQSRELSLSLGSVSEFFVQVRRRIPPNPIQATIENEGNLLSGNRLKYQLQSMRRRAFPSVRATWLGLKYKAGRPNK